MMRTTAMNSVQIMKEIKDGSKKENIKSVYTFHVSNKIRIWEFETGNGVTNRLTHPSDPKPLKSQQFKQDIEKY